MSEEFRFWSRQQVRYRDVDLQQIVYFAKYLEYVDIALDDYWRSLGFATSEKAPAGEWDTAMVHVELDYHAPARYDDQLDIGIRVTRLGTASLNVAFLIRRGDTPLVSGSLVLVNFDRHAARSRPLPARLRAAVAEREGL